MGKVKQGFSRAGMFMLMGSPNLGDDQARPACSEDWVNPEWFWYDEELTASKANPDLIHAQAIQVCMRCPVIEACDEWAFKNKLDAGVWGGRTPRERRRILRELKKAERQKVPA